jgi:programmed cell death protein 5|tara:strand:+ start:72 stop:404 length:333 start_codon:yes stop_codon:yes gene_type:complete
MDKLEEIKKRKLEELKNAQLGQLQQQTQEEEQLKQQIQQLEMIVKQALTKEALERYGNLKAAFPERAVQVLVILTQALQSGQITQVDDDTLKEILKKISPEKKDIKIKRV